MKKIILVSSPATQFKVEHQKTIYAKEDDVYIMTEGLTFSRTQEQSEAYINELVLKCNELKEKLDKILDIVYPDRYDEEE